MFPFFGLLFLGAVILVAVIFFAIFVKNTFFAGNDIPKVLQKEDRLVDKQREPTVPVSNPVSNKVEVSYGGLFIWRLLLN